MFSKRISAELSRLVETLKSFLRPYLESQEVLIDERGYFSCINPDHADSSPSMHFIPGSDESKTKCWSCGATYDIFDAQHIFEDAPQRGSAWVHQNVHRLARRYDIPFDDTPPTESEQLEIDLWRLYDDATRIFMEQVKKKPDVGFQHTRARGLLDETCSQYGVGSVQWRPFCTALKASGHNLEFAKEYGIDKTMFSEEHITFVIRDVDGGAVGFTRRWTAYDKATHRGMKERGEGHKYPPKYKTTPAKVIFFQHESILYGLDTAKKHKYRRLDIFEGQPDVLSARQVGHMPCVCAAGVELTRFQVMAAVAAGFSHINLVFDYDDAGHKAARKFLKDFSGQEDLTLTVTFLNFSTEVDEKDRDPDGYFRLYGLEAFLELEPVSSFDWTLHELLSDPQVDKLAVASEMVSHILSVSDRIARSSYIEQLSQRTGVDEVTIRSEIQRREDKHVISLADTMERQLFRARDASEKAAVIAATALELEGLGKTSPDVSIGEVVNAFEVACVDFETPKEGILGYSSGWELFDERFDGIPKREALIGIAGTANSGKSAFVTTLALNLLLYNPDTVVIYHIMDDPRRIAFAKILSRVTGFPIRSILRASTVLQQREEEWERYTKAREHLKEMMTEGRLIVKGQDLGTGTNQATALIDHVTEVTKQVPIYIADSLHNISNSFETESERIRVKRVVEWAQWMSDTKGVSMIFTMELNKSGMRGRPRMETTAETAKISFAFKAIGMLYNELHDTREEANTYWVDSPLDPITKAPGPKDQLVKRPILEINWEKNKITDYKGRMYWKLWDHCATCEPVTLDDVRAYELEAKKQRFQPNSEVVASFEGAMPPAPAMEVTAYAG